MAPQEFTPGRTRGGSSYLFPATGQWQGGETVKTLARAAALGALAVLVPAVAAAATITTTPTDLYDIFPQTTQGENGVYAMHRDVATGVYTDLAYASDYNWNTPDGAVYWYIPILSRAATAGKIGALPAGIGYSGVDRDVVMRVVLEGALPQVRITGSFGTDYWPNMTFYIYKGLGGWTTPLWAAQCPDNPQVGTFDLTIPFQSGDEIFFAVNGQGSSRHRDGFWQDVRLTGLPEPATLGLLAVGGAGLLLRLRR
jgi:hypothetical protein